MEMDKQDIIDDKGKIFLPLNIPEKIISNIAPRPIMIAICSGLRLKPSSVSPRIKYKNKSPPKTQRVSLIEGALKSPSHSLGF
jgi:hypothetical protein